MSDDMEFDLGPLTWVKAELDNALEAAREALAAWNGEDINPLKAAAAHLHQVHGALQIVDLRGVSQVCAETERLLDDMAARAETRNPGSAEVVLRAIAELKAYLDGLMSGGTHAEIRLAPILNEVVTRRGGEPPAPSELFYPDTGQRVPREAPEPVLDDEARRQAIHAARLRYQRGLLLFLQNKDAATGLARMEEALRDVEAVAPGGAQYSFWWSAAGLVEALRRGGVPVDFWVKRLCGRVDLQMRRLMEGSRQLADRLFRDVLYFVARDDTPDGRAARARDLFQLRRYLPDVAGAGWSAEQRQHLGLLKEHVGQAKDHWIRYCSGRVDSLEPFQRAALALFEAAARLPNEAMRTLTRIIQAVAKRLPGAGDATGNEALQLEMATALLLAQNAAEHYQALDEQFTRQSEAQAMRLQAAIDPAFDRSRIPAVEMLDDISRAAQEKLVVAQVTHEIQANLNQVEEILDKFFRNAAERAGLPLVPALMNQVLGALNILQLDVAANLAREAAQRIEHFNQADAYIAPENLDWVAEALSTLSLYMDGLRYGRDDNRVMLALLARPEVRAGEEETVESQVREETERILDSAAQLAREDAGDASARQTLRGDLTQLARDADLIGDRDLRGRADAALRALNEDAPAAEVREALAGAAEVTVPKPSEQAVRLAASTDEAVDRELLDTYIEEANQVLGEIAIKVARLQVSPYDQDAFTTVRRGFHTLKGSGRMVGLGELAEPAWEIEQTLNLWLRDERAPDPAMLAFLEDAGNAFQVWVGELEEQGRARVESAALVARARALRGEGAAEPPPPKAEAGVPAAPDAGDPTAAATDAVDIDGHVLPAELFAIFSAEATQRLSDLRAALADMALGQRVSAWEAFLRAAHTLAGIARTTGFVPLSDSAGALEHWASTWPDKTRALNTDEAAAVASAVERLASLVQDILAHRFPAALPDFASALPQPAAGVESGAEQAASPSAGDADDAIDASKTGPAASDVDEHVAAEATREYTVAHVDEAPPAPVALPPAVDELDPELLPIFLEEAAELLPRIGESLRAWRAAPADVGVRDAIKRALHTLKGSSRMAGAMTLGESVHALETRVIELPEGAADDDFLDAMEAAYDRIADVIDQLRSRGEPAASPDAAAVAGPTPPAPADEPVATGFAPEHPVSVGVLATAAERRPAAAVVQPPPRTRSTLRVKSDILDTLLNEAGEVSIARSRIENVLSAYKQTAQELSTNVDRLRAQLRELEIQAETQMHSRLARMEESQFDPLEFDRFTRLQELTRMMAESVNDVSTAQENLLQGLNEADGALIHQGRMARTLQQELMRLRMLPLGTLAERLHRVARLAAKETGRKAQLELEGAQTELDRGVLDRIAAPLEHLVRNAVAHGIEPPERRLASGKAEYGEIRLEATRESNEIVLTLSDDGAGIDYAAVRARARALGWIADGDDPAVEELHGFLFRSGFTTSDTVTEIAGRGIGLDVVRNEIAGIGGRVRLESTPGQGTRFVIRLPLTLALTQVVLADAGGQVWALAANLVVLVREVTPEQAHALHELGHVTFDDEVYPLRTLAELVGREPRPSEGPLRTILLLRAGEQRLALRVDHLEGNHEAVVKNIGPQLARIVGITGATVLGDGRVALILNPFQLAERAPRVHVTEEVASGEQAPLIMVVDDSLTVRKITSRFLQREGYRVVTARDGVEALELLEREVPAVMLLDIEMPRMDGFEVARHVRLGRVAPKLPIIMITSRTAEKHRGHALELGVNTYMGKPYQEDELLAEIVRLSGVPAPTPA